MDINTHEPDPHTAAHVAKMLFAIGAERARVTRGEDMPTMVHIDGIEICEIGNPRNRPIEKNEIAAGIGNQLSALCMGAATLYKFKTNASILLERPNGNEVALDVCMKEFEHPGHPYMIRDGNRIYDPVEMFGKM